MPQRVRRLTSRELEDILRRHGFICVSSKDSHRKWRNIDQHLQEIVPEHAGRILPIGTLLNILTHAEIPESEWRD